MGKNKFPVYIISKGRAFNPLTARLFENSGIDYLIAVEPQEKEEYIKALSKKRVLELPFQNLGLGSFPARNYCWQHSISLGASRHWLFDDNIQRFVKWHNGKRTKMENILESIIFIENNSIKFDSDISGYEEPNFVVRLPKTPFKHNCHIYSALLIKNSIPYRWRLKYNEDIDLCLQVLHNGGSTLSCIYYMADKVSTSQKMKGGNQSELYQNNDPKKKLLKARMIESVWPQYCRTVIKFGRYHHQINWKVFQQRRK